MNRLLRGSLALACALGFAPAAHAGSVKTVEVEVPLPSQLKLPQGARLGFFELPATGGPYHSGAELINALRRDLLRAGNLRLAEGAPAEVAGRGTDALAADAAFVRDAAASRHADYLLGGELRWMSRELSRPFGAAVPPAGEPVAAADREVTLTFEFLLFDGHTGALVHRESFTVRERFTPAAAMTTDAVLRLYDLFRRDLLRLIAASRRREIRYLFKS